jgi:hypothetical protein
MTDEHVLPVSVGGTLVTRRFCENCNGLGGQIEQLLAQYPDLQERVGRYAIPDRRGAPQRPHREVTYADGSRGHMQYTPDGPKGADIFPRLLSGPDAGTAVYEVPEEHMEVFLASRKKKGKTVEVVSRRRASYTGATTRYGIGTTTAAVWGRFAAKVALGAVSMLDLDEEWLDTEGARALRGLFLRDALPPYPVGVFPSVIGDEHPLTAMLHAPEHLLWLQPRPEGGSTLGLVLFGDLQFSLSILDLRCPPDHPTWHVRPGHAPPHRESFAAVTGRLLDRTPPIDA